MQHVINRICNKASCYYFDK